MTRYVSQVKSYRQGPKHVLYSLVLRRMHASPHATPKQVVISFCGTATRPLTPHVQKRDPDLAVVCILLPGFPKSARAAHVEMVRFFGAHLIIGHIPAHRAG
jgi:hypothetical protein